MRFENCPDGGISSWKPEQRRHHIFFARTLHGHWGQDIGEVFFLGGDLTIYSKYLWSSI